MLCRSKGLRIFIYPEEIDMRFGFNKLQMMCENQMRADLDEGHLYVFLGKNHKRLKLLWYDGTGLILAVKKMEKGHFMKLVDIVQRGEMSRSDFKQILHGGVLKIIPDLSKEAVTQRESVELPPGFK